MGIFKRLVPRSLKVRYAWIAILSFTIGSATVVEAAPTIAVFRLADGADATMLAAVDASGDQHVKVNNFPTTQAVSGTVTVGNAAADPASFRDTDNPARQAVQVMVHGHQNADYNVDIDAYTVPAGKRLVIEHVSGEVGMYTATSAVVQLITYLNSIYGLHELRVAPAESWGVGGVLRPFSESLRLYADGGTHVHVNVARPTIGEIDTNVTISGYLIETP